MKKFRKCDTTKYRRRREKQKAAHVVRAERRRQEEARQYAIWEARRQAALQERRRRHQLEQDLVNVLAARICQLDPEYSSFLKLRAITRAIGWMAKETQILPILKTPITLEEISEIPVIRDEDTGARQANFTFDDT